MHQAAAGLAFQGTMASFPPLRTPAPKPAGAQATGRPMASQQGHWCAPKVPSIAIHALQTTSCSPRSPGQASPHKRSPESGERINGCCQLLCLASLLWELTGIGKLTRKVYLAHQCRSMGPKPLLVGTEPFRIWSTSLFS